MNITVPNNGATVNFSKKGFCSHSSSTSFTLKFTQQVTWKLWNALNVRLDLASKTAFTHQMHVKKNYEHEFLLLVKERTGVRCSKLLELCGYRLNYSLTFPYAVVSLNIVRVSSVTCG